MGRIFKAHPTHPLERPNANSPSQNPRNPKSINAEMQNNSRMRSFVSRGVRVLSGQPTRKQRQPAANFVPHQPSRLPYKSFASSSSWFLQGSLRSNTALAKSACPDIRPLSPRLPPVASPPISYGGISAAGYQLSACRSSWALAGRSLLAPLVGRRGRPQTPSPAPAPGALLSGCRLGPRPALQPQESRPTL